MSDAPSRTPSPGWYPDPEGGTLQRYWDGARWTDRTYDPISASPAPGVYRTIDPGAKLSTAWVWIIAAVPVISLISNLSVDYRQYLLDAIAQSPGSATGLPAGLGTQLLVGAVGWALYLGTALLAFFDWRELRRRGVDRPFHWAWSFLGGIVYMIGRAVVIRRRGGSAFAPMWVYIALLVLTVVVSLVRVFGALAEVIDQVPGSA